MRRARRVDANHAEIIAAFRKLGCSVLDMSGLGDGAPDICVGFGGIQIMCELKDGTKPPSARKLTKAEEEFRLNWTGGYKIVESLEHVAETVTLLQHWHRKLRA